MENNFSDLSDNKKLFSGLGKGYINRHGKAVLQVKPDSTLTLEEVHDYITSDAAKKETMELRQITDHDQAQKYKMLNFKVVLFGGIFSKRNAQDIALHSGLMIIDIDKLASDNEVVRVRKILIEDKRLSTVLCFISPTGTGVKAAIWMDPQKELKYPDYFKWVYQYILFTYGIEIDTSGSDICRACYLPYDPECYLNPNIKVTSNF